MNMTVKTAIQAILHDLPDDEWDEVLGDLVHSYNRREHRTTKCQPYEVMFGRRYAPPPIPLLRQMVKCIPQPFFLSNSETVHLFVMHSQTLKKELIP